jgi:hypothetical protein
VSKEFLEKEIMRFFIIHLKDKDGNRLDYMTGEKKLGKLIEKYDTVMGYLKKEGFTPIKDGKDTLESTTQSKEGYCSEHDTQMDKVKGKYGEFWSHYKEENEKRIYCNGDGWKD